RQSVARNAYGLYRFTQREAVRRDQHVVSTFFIAIDRNKAALAELFRVDNLAVDVRENLEHRADAQVITVTAHAVADFARPLEVLLERVNADELANLAVTKNSHGDHKPKICAANHRFRNGAFRRGSDLSQLCNLNA